MVTETMRTQVLELYTAYFNRAADRDGVDYWLNEMDVKGWDVLTVASSFTDSPEYTNLYGSKTNAQIVDSVYQNVLGRSGDAAGVAYWLGQLNGGTIAVQNFITAVVNAATEEINGAAKWPEDKAMVDNKSAVSQYCYDLNINNAGISLASVTQNASSINSIKAYIDEIASSDFTFTQEWLSGKTLINVFEGGEWGETIDMATLVFNANGTGNAIHADGGAFTYSVDGEGVIMITFPDDDEPIYLGAIEMLDSVNAVRIEYAWDQAEAQTYYEGDEYEFLALDQAAANYLASNFYIA